MQWMLFEPNGWVLSYRADGWYSHHPGDGRPHDEEWMPVLTLSVEEGQTPTPPRTRLLRVGRRRTPPV
jgi:hypothetical protein